MHSKFGLSSHLWLCTCTAGVGWGGVGGVVEEEEEEGHWAVMKVRLLLLPLISCFRLLPLNHAATHNAVKAPQVEEGDGPK